MDKETFEALKKTMHHCEYGGPNDKEFWDNFKQVEGWIQEVEKDYSEEDDQGFPLCPKYQDKVLPDENDNCSLCGEHSASELDEKEEWLANGEHDKLREEDYIPKKEEKIGQCDVCHKLYGNETHYCKD